MTYTHTITKEQLNNIMLEAINNYLNTTMNLDKNKLTIKLVEVTKSNQNQYNTKLNNMIGKAINTKMSIYFTPKLVLNDYNNHKLLTIPNNEIKQQLEMLNNEATIFEENMKFIEIFKEYITSCSNISMEFDIAQNKDFFTGFHLVTNSLNVVDFKHLINDTVIEIHNNNEEYYVVITYFDDLLNSNN